MNIHSALAKSGIALRLAFLTLIASAFNVFVPAYRSRTCILEYEVIKNGKVIGNMRVKKVSTGDTCRYTMSSNIQFSMLLDFKSEMMEESLHINGILMHSTFKRIKNGKETFKKMYMNQHNYFLLKNGNTEPLSLKPISHNTHSLYHQEPVNQDKSWSLNFQQFIPITPIKNNSYKLSTPENEDMIYHYRNGICYWQEINHPLVKLDILLKEMTAL